MLRYCLPIQGAQKNIWHLLRSFCSLGKVCRFLHLKSCKFRRVTCSDDIGRLIWQQYEEGWIGEDKIGGLKYKLLRDMATIQVRVMKA